LRDLSAAFASEKLIEICEDSVGPAVILPRKLKGGHFKALDRTMATLILDNTAIGQGGFDLKKNTAAFFAK
jgi:hypothetical protein